MPLFPVFLHLEGRRCLVVGGGNVGLARSRALLGAGAEVRVVDPFPSPGLRALADEVPGLRLEVRCFEAGDCKTMTLVFACTDRPEINAEVVAAARLDGVLACRADDGEEGDFTNGATLRRGEVCLAVASGASSPALSARVRDRIAETIGEEYGEAAALLGGLRRRTGSGAGRRRLLAQVLDEGLVELLGEGRRDEALALVDRAAGTVGSTGPTAGDRPAKGEPCTR